MIRVRTRTPEFISDIGDMLRLFLGDVLMTVCDPRIRLTGKGGDTR